MSFAPPKPGPFDQPPPPARSGCTPAAMLLLGCSGFMLVCALICGGAGVYTFRWGLKQVNQFAEVYEQKGYERHAGQVIEVKKSPTQNTVYVCQVLKVESDVDVDLAIMCQVAEINADVHGNVEFFGQVLSVAEDASIDGDLYIKGAQSIEIHGEVKGKISGSYQQLTYRGKKYSSGKSPSSEAESAESEVMPPASPAAPTPPEAPATPELPESTGPAVKQKIF